MDADDRRDVADPPGVGRRVGLGLALACLPVAAAFAFLEDHRAADAKEPKKLQEKGTSYDDPKLRAVDPSLIGYREVTRIETGFAVPRAMALDGRGNVIVGGRGAVRVFDPRGEKLAEIALDEMPTALAVSADGDYLVGLKDRVRVVTAAGAVKGEWRLAPTSHVTSIAVSGADVYLADAGQRVVHRLDTSGKVVDVIGKADPSRGLGGLVVPSAHLDVAVSAEGLVWVANPGMHRLEAYTPEGRFERFWGAPGATVEGFFGCCNPANFAIAGDGRFVTAEKGLPRVKVYDEHGQFASVVAPPAVLGENPVGLDVAVDGAGRVLVMDPVTRSVRVFVAAEGGRP